MALRLSRLRGRTSSLQTKSERDTKRFNDVRTASLRRKLEIEAEVVGKSKECVNSREMPLKRRSAAESAEDRGDLLGFHRSSLFDADG